MGDETQQVSVTDLANAPLDPAFADPEDVAAQEAEKAGGGAKEGDGKAQQPENAGSESGKIAEDPPKEGQGEAGKEPVSAAEIVDHGITDEELDALVEQNPDLAQKVMRMMGSASEHAPQEAKQDAVVGEDPQQAKAGEAQSEIDQLPATGSDQSFNERRKVNSAFGEWQGQIDKAKADIQIVRSAIDADRAALEDLSEDSAAYRRIEAHIQQNEQWLSDAEKYQSDMGQFVARANVIREEINDLPELRPYASTYMNMRLRGEIGDTDSAGVIRQKLAQRLKESGVSVRPQTNVALQDRRKSERKEAVRKELAEFRANRKGGGAKKSTPNGQANTSQGSSDMTAAQRQALELI